MIKEAVVAWFWPVVIVLTIVAVVCFAVVQNTAPPNPALICPHCQTKGQVRTTRTRHKAGVSGAKATGAVLTLGVSLLATGLSRKEWVTNAHCLACGSKWMF